MKKFLKSLQRSKIFGNMTAQEIEAAVNCLQAQIRSYRKGQAIYSVGENISAVALLLEGSVHIRQQDYWGNQSILAEISEADMFGEAYACLQSESLAVDAVAARDSVVLFLEIDRLFSSANRMHTRLVRNLLTELAVKNRMLTRKLTHMSQRTTREKLLSYLSAQAQRANSPVFAIPFNRQQLADYLAVDRSAMSAELCKLRDAGVLTFYKNQFHLKQKS